MGAVGLNVHRGRRGLRVRAADDRFLPRTWSFRVNTCARRSRRGDLLCLYLDVLLFERVDLSPDHLNFLNVTAN